MRTRAFVRVLVGTMCLIAAGRGPAVQAESTWTSFTSSNGAQAVAVSHNVVWVGTTGGLVQWDAAAGTYVRHLAPEGFPDNSVSAATVDAAGRLWVGLGTWNGGVAVLDAGRWTYWTAADGLASDWVTCLAGDGAGRIWIGTVRGVSVLDDRETLADTSDDLWATFGTTDGLLGESVNAVCVDMQGRVWSATSSGVSVLDAGGTPFDKSDDVWTHFTSAAGLLADAVYGISVDTAGRFWFATTSGVSVLDARSTLSDASDDVWNSFGVGEGLPEKGSSLAVTFDAAGTAWISHQKGLVALEGASTPFDRTDDVITLFTAADGLLKSSVRAVAFDEQGFAWCAVPSGGLDRFNPRGTPSDKSDDTWTAYVTEDWLPSANIQAVATEDDVTWVGASGGLVAFSHNQSERFSVGAPLAFQQSTAGVLWIATTGGLVAFIDGGTPFDPTDDATAYFTVDDGLSASYVVDLSVDVEGRVWCATSKGISVLDAAGTVGDKSDDEWATFTTADGLAGNSTNAIAAEGDDRVWVVHESKSVSVLDYGGTPFDTSDDAWALFGESSPIGIGSGYAVVIDSAGIKWFGMCPGLFAFDDGGTLLDTGDDRWHRFDIGDCDPGVAIDETGRKWVATGWSGVTMLDDGGTPFDASDDTLTDYTIDDGLIDNRTQAIAAAEGIVWIATDGGLSRLVP